jgi:hypothetical protein
MRSGRRREPERADLAPPGRHADLVLERRYRSTDRIIIRVSDERAAELPDQAGRVERRPAGEVRPFEQDDVAPPSRASQ